MNVMKTYAPLFLITAISWSNICLPVIDQVTVRTTDGSVVASTDTLNTTNIPRASYSTTECAIGISSQQLKTILPFLDHLAHGETFALKQKLTTLNLTELGHIIETASSLNVEPLITQGTESCTKKLTNLGFIQNPVGILTQLKMLSPKMDNVIATQFMNAHPDVMSWLLSHCELEFAQRKFDTNVTSVWFNHDGTMIATLYGTDLVDIWNTKSGKLLQVLNSKRCSMFDPIVNLKSAQFNHHGTMLAAGSDDGKVNIWDIRSGKLLQTLFHGHERITSIQFSPDDIVLATCSEDGTAKIWNMKFGSFRAGEHFHSFDNIDYWADSCYFNQDSTQFVSCSNSSVQIRNIKSGALICEYHSKFRIDSAHFSPDGAIRILTTPYCRVSIWDSKSGLYPHLFNPDPFFVGLIQLSHEGTILATYSKNIVKIWNVKSGKLLKTFDDPDWRSTRLSPDGTMIATNSGNAARIYNLTPLFQLEELFKKLSLEQALTIIAIYQQQNDEQALGTLAPYFDSLPAAIKNIFIAQIPTLGNK